MWELSKIVHAFQNSQIRNLLEIRNFFKTPFRLKGALDYFEKENPHSIELNNVRDLHELGGDALSREFGELIKKVTIYQ